MKAVDTDRPAVRRAHFQECISCICSVVSWEQWRVDLHLKLGLSFNVLLSFVFPLEELEKKTKLPLKSDTHNQDFMFYGFTIYSKYAILYHPLLAQT